MNNLDQYKILKEIINEVDPIGLVDFDTPESLNEYDPELKEIVKEDIAEMDAQELGQRIYEIFVKYFNQELAGEKDKYVLIAEEFMACK